MTANNPVLERMQQCRIFEVEEVKANWIFDVETDPPFSEAYSSLLCDGYLFGYSACYVIVFRSLADFLLPRCIINDRRWPRECMVCFSLPFISN
ncbi:hypothetical protein JTB14_031136 [Gonioctena quinquepunctata]|nr:hypothetical protein JTB14_031136 [Gonioctena quinquepunctata]